MNNLSRDTLLGAIIVLIVAIYPVFGNLAYLPVQLWDESRLAMNAFEMHRSGEWLVTTFDGEPDLWNTKPPLMIWLQVFCIKVNGLNELSLRIPSALASLVTFLILYWFAAVKLKNPLLGVVICLVLITSPAYVGLHRTRTGDYDALLTFFTTAYSIFFYVYAEEKKSAWFYYGLLCLIGGAMTKGVAALIFLPAMLAFFATTGQLRFLLRQREVYLGITLFVLCIGGYYLLREWRMQGYLGAVLFNDVTGRFGDPSTTEGNDLLYYARNVLKGSFSWWAALVPVALVYFFTTHNKAATRLGLYSLSLGIFYFIVVSVSRTKNTWYDMPVYPVLSIAVALVFTQAINWLSGKLKAGTIIKPVLVIGLFILPYIQILSHIKTEQSDNSENGSIMFLMKNILHDPNHDRNFSVVWDDYHGNLYWYLKVLRHQGREIKTARYDDLKPGMNIAAFQKKVQNYIEARYHFQVTGQVETVKFYQITN